MFMQDYFWPQDNNLFAQDIIIIILRSMDTLLVKATLPIFLPPTSTGVNFFFCLPSQQVSILKERYCPGANSKSRHLFI